jgi:hypothetical protein
MKFAVLGSDFANLNVHVYNSCKHTQSVPNDMYSELYLDIQTFTCAVTVTVNPKCF